MYSRYVNSTCSMDDGLSIVDTNPIIFFFHLRVSSNSHTLCSVYPSILPSILPSTPPSVLLPSSFYPPFYPSLLLVVCVCIAVHHSCTPLMYTTRVQQKVEILKEHAVESLINRLENMINVGYTVIRQLSDQSKYMHNPHQPIL